MKLKKWLCLIALALVCVLLPLAITAEMGIKRPDCTCSGADSVAGHRQECAYRTYFETLYTEKTAEELAHLWTQLTGDEQNFVINDLSWDLDPFKREALIRLLNGDETKPEETAPATTAPAETVPEETVPGETVPGETVPGETVPGETVPEETVPEENVPEETQKTVLSDPATGVQVSGKGLPEGVSLKVTNLAKRQLRGPVFRFDITLFDENSESWQPENKVRVKIPVKASQGEKLAIVHTHGSSTYLLDVVTVQADGTVEFQTDGFSEFAGFTVDFHYNNADFSIDGMTSILLSELFTAMDIPEDASKVSQVTFSDPSLIQVTRQEGDWLLTSLQAFQTEETLLITFTDGHSITIDVTDAETKYEYIWGDTAYVKTEAVDFTTNTGLYTLYNATAPKTNETQLYSEEHYMRRTGNSALRVHNPGEYWYYAYEQKNIDQLDYYGHSTEDNCQTVRISASTFGGNEEVRVDRIPRGIIANSSLITVKQKGYMATASETRTVNVYLNNGASPVASQSTIFANRGDSSVAPKQLEVTPNSNYYYSGSYSYSNLVYRIDLYTRYTVKFNANGGSGSMANQAFIWGTAQNLTANAFTGPTLTVSFNGNGGTAGAASLVAGSSFNGWKDSNGTSYANQQSVNSLTATAGGTINLYAQWKGNAITLPSATAPTGYSFAGWYTAASGGTRVGGAGSSYTPTANTTLYAQWTPKTDATYTVHYYLSGTTTKVQADKVATGMTYNKSYTESAPTVTGYQVTGDTSKSVTAGYSGNEIAFYYTRNNYAVTYDANGGSGAPGKQEKQHGVSLTLSAGTPSKTGYSFQYWNGSDGKTYYPGGAYTTNAALTLTAKWNPVTYTITYNLAGGKLTEQNPGSFTIESDPITLFPPTRDGYQFAGWTGSNGTTPEALVTIPTGSTGNRNYTANWEEASFTITYDLAGGTLATANPESYGVSTPGFTLHNPTKDGYIFAGWTGSNGTTAQTTVTVETGSFGNKSYTANWDPITYTVRFDGNGATSGTTPDQTYRYGVAQKLNKNGYQRQYTVTYIPGDGTVDPRSVTAEATFDGWRYGEDVAGDQALVSNLTTTNGAVVTLTAQWTLATVTLPTPQLHNHQFLGWYDAATDGNRLGGAGEVITPTENMTLYAQWQRTHVDVKASFDGGRGTAAPATQAIALGADATVTFTANSGYLLDYITVNGDRVELSSETAYTHTLTGLTEDQTLVAYTVPNAYTVTYDADGGTMGQTTQTKYYGVDLVLLTADPEKPGYRFLHWLGSDGEQYASGATYTENRELTLTAQWQVQYRYRLHFDANTADSVTSMPEDLALTAWQDGASYSYSWQAAPQRAGYRFLGWSVNADSDEAPINNAYVLTGAAADTASETLYAIWQENTATYTYQLEGSGSLSLTTETVPVKTGAASGATVNLPQGYKLVGWYDAVGDQVSTQLHFIPQKGADGLYAGGTYTARVIQKTDDLTITLTGIKTPVILTVKSANGLEMTFVADSTVTVENLPEGSYTVEAEAWGSNVTASVTTVNGELREGDPAAFTVAVSKTSGWSVVTAWVRNFFGMNDR